MRKFLSLLLLICFLGLTSIKDDGDLVFAEETTTEVTSEATETDATLDLTTLVAKLPCLNQAILYSWDDNEVKYAMSFTVVSLLNDHINLDAMYVPATEVGGLISAKLFNLGNWVKFPLLEYIEFEPFVYYGLKDIGSGSDIGEADYGAGVKLLSIKF